MKWEIMRQGREKKVVTGEVVSLRNTMFCTLFILLCNDTIIIIYILMTNIHAYTMILSLTH